VAEQSKLLSAATALVVKTRRVASRPHGTARIVTARDTRLAADQNENPLCNNICKQRTKRIATKCEIAVGTLIAERLPSRP